MYKLHISIVIPSYQSSSTITDCLESVFNQNTNTPYEVIVVDSSSDETPEVILQRFPTVRLIALSKRTLPGTARNIGVDTAKGEIIAFLDSDCVAEPDWLERRLDLHHQGYRIVGGSVKNGTPGNLIGTAGYVCEFREFQAVGKPRFVDHVPTCNISYDQDLLASSGGFPDEYYPQEDLLFHRLLMKENDRIYFDPELCVFHLNRTEWKSFLKHQMLIGQVTRRVLQIIDLPGSAFNRLGILGVIFVPLLTFVKFWRTKKAFPPGNPDTRMMGLKLWLMVALGLGVWGMGFAREMASKIPGSETIQDRSSINNDSASFAESESH